MREWSERPLFGTVVPVQSRQSSSCRLTPELVTKIWLAQEGDYKGTKDKKTKQSASEAVVVSFYIGSLSNHDGEAIVSEAPARDWIVVKTIKFV